VSAEQDETKGGGKISSPLSRNGLLHTYGSAFFQS